MRLLQQKKEQEHYINLNIDVLLSNKSAKERESKRDLETIRKYFNL